MTRIFVTFLAALGFASAAGATPPDVTNIHDEILGINPTHVFVLRTTDDNQGSHYESRNEVFLVAIDLTSASEEYWPLYQVAQTTDFGDDGTDDRIVIETTVGPDSPNAYAILAERNALPWIGQGSWRQPLATDSDAVALTITYQDGTKYRQARDELAKRLEASIANVASNVTNHRRMSTMTTQQIFAAHEVNLSSCTYTNPAGHYSRSQRQWVQLIRVTCGDEEEMGSTSVIQPVPVVIER